MHFIDFVYLAVGAVISSDVFVSSVLLSPKAFRIYYVLYYHKRGQRNGIVHIIQNK